MKKNKILMIVALVAAMFAFSGCDLLNQVAGLTQDKWCKKTVQYGDKPVAVYLYYTNETDASEGRLDLVQGLNIVVEATGPSVTLFGEAVGGKYYVTKAIPKGTNFAEFAKEAGADNTSSAVKKGSSIVINDGTWLIAYEAADEKDVSRPDSLSSSSDFMQPTDLVQADFWKEMLAEKLVELLLQ